MIDSCSDYRPQRSCGKVMFSQACVKNSVHKGGGLCPSMHHRSHDQRGGLCLGRGGSLSRPVRETPLDRYPPYGNEWPVRILLECILVLEIFLVKLLVKY